MLNLSLVIEPDGSGTNGDGRQVAPLVVGLLVILVSVSVTGKDFEGQRFKLIEPYPGSTVVEFERDAEVTSREVILGRLKKVNNVLRPESSRFVRGTRTAITYRIQGERRIDVVHRYLTDQLLDQGEILYQCEGRGCGSSNHWSNAIFERAVLYGPEEFQRYMLARMTGEQVYYVAVYIARRGTGELYTHLDIVASEEARQITDAGVIGATLKSRGKYVLPWVVADDMVAAVAEALKNAPGYRVAVVGHDKTDAGESPGDAMRRTAERAGKLVERLVSAGVSASRLENYGVGPLAPSDNQPRSRLELVLLDNQ